MKRHLCIIAAAALTIGGFSYVRAADDQPNALERAADKTGSAVEKAAEKTGDAIGTAADKTKSALGLEKKGHSEEINDMLAQVVEAALTKDGIDDVAERFVDADRNRLGQDKEALKNPDTLNGRIDQIRKDWKAKYGHDFDIKDEDKVYGGFAMITEGEETGGARTAGAKVDANVNSDSGSAKVEVKNDSGVDVPKANTDGQTAADKNLNDKGRNIATVTIAASHGFPELKVPLIHEAGGWKIDAPDSLDAMKLRDNVQTALTHCGDMKDKWSSDENEAYRAFTHSVLTAIFDKEGEVQKASDTQAPDANSARPAAPAAP